MTFPYEFTLAKFECENSCHNVAITPYLFGGLDGLDFNGAVTGTIISDNFGTRHFMLEDWGEGEWVCTDGFLSEAVAKKILTIYYLEDKIEFEFNLYRVEIEIQTPSETDEARAAADN